MSQEIEKLKSRIAELESELKQKDHDLNHFKNELVQTNVALEKMIAQMSQEIKLAALIQKSLTPTEFPNITGVEFSTKFIPGTLRGGDYFDIFEHEDKFRFGILISSASGYAMSALFLSVMLKFTGQMQARKGTDPDIILQNMAKDIVPHVSGQDQAQLFYAVVDRRSFEVSYSSAGKMTGLHHSYANNRLSTLDAALPSLSSDFDAQPQISRLSLNPRDRLIWVTDGIINAKNQQGEIFGIERLFKAVLRAPKSGVHEVRNEILYRLEKFTGKAEFDRDITVIVIEVKDKVIKLAKSP